jgi:hypothetical protein
MRTVAAVLAMALLISCARADDRRREYAPELNAYHHLPEGMRLFLLADTSKVEGRDSWQNEMGAHLDISTKRAARARRHLADWARARKIGLRIGYRQLRTWDGEREDVEERRGLVELTLRGALPNQFAIAHRFGFDYRDLSTGAAQRYRYRLDVERQFTAGETVLVPYARAELSYDSRYSAWSRQRYQLGAEIEISKHWRIEPYLALDKDREPTERYTDRLGLIAKLYW